MEYFGPYAKTVILIKSSNTSHITFRYNCRYVGNFLLKVWLIVQYFDKEVVSQECGKIII